MKQKPFLFIFLFVLLPFMANAQTDLTGATVTLNPTAYDYDGTECKPKVSGIRKGTKRYNSLVEGVDYDITYENNVNAGEATATLTFKGDYTGIAIQKFTINPKDLTREESVILHLDVDEVYCDGYPQEPSAKDIYYNERSLVPGTDFDLSYENNISPGVAYATATFKGNFAGSKMASFVIKYAEGLKIDEINFPDENFRNWVLSQSYGKDWVLTDEEIASITSIKITNKEIRNLKGLELFTSLTSIDDNAFYEFYSLVSVVMPNSVTTIGSNAFYECSGLKSLIISNNVTSIGQSAFFGCSNLTSITIPNSVSSIGRYAFYGTPWYDNQPNGLVYAGNVAYAYKGNMPQNTSIYIKEGTTSITGYAFDNCSSLVSVIIPTTVKSIGNWAFADCSDLIDVYCYARKGPTASDGIFNNSGIQFATLHVPETSVNGYRTTTPWSGFGNIVALQDNDPKPEPKPEPTPEYIRGDVNLDGIVNGTDIQEVINIIVEGE